MKLVSMRSPRLIVAAALVAAVFVSFAPGASAGIGLPTPLAENDCDYNVASSCTNGGDCEYNIYSTCDGGYCDVNVASSCDGGSCFLNIYNNCGF